MAALPRSAVWRTASPSMRWETWGAAIVLRIGPPAQRYAVGLGIFSVPQPLCAWQPYSAESPSPSPPVKRWATNVLGLLLLSLDIDDVVLPRLVLKGVGPLY